MSLLSRLFFVPLLLFLVPGLSGCSESKSSASPVESKDSDHGDHHDDHSDSDHESDEHGHDHGHSHGPAYKPDTFEEALKEIKHRLSHMKSDIKGGHLDHVEEEMGKLKEFINWLPELAADSDLPEKEWNQVNAETKTMLGLCEVAGKELKAGTLKVEFTADLKKKITELQKLLPLMFISISDSSGDETDSASTPDTKTPAASEAAPDSTPEAENSGRE